MHWKWKYRCRFLRIPPKIESFLRPKCVCPRAGSRAVNRSPHVHDHTSGFFTCPPWESRSNLFAVKTMILRYPRSAVTPLLKHVKFISRHIIILSVLVWLGELVRKTPRRWICTVFYSFYVRVLPVRFLCGSVGVVGSPLQCVRARKDARLSLIWSNEIITIWPCCVLSVFIY